MMEAEMKKPEPRNDEDLDDGDRMAFALAGLSSTATQALHESLIPGPRGWVASYPMKLVEGLEFWVDKVRALDESGAASAACEKEAIAAHAEASGLLFDSSIRTGQIVWLGGSGNGFSDDEFFADVIMDASDGSPYLHESMSIFRNLPEWAQNEEEFPMWVTEEGHNGFIVQVETPKPVKFHKEGHTSYGFGFTASTWIYVEDMADVTVMAMDWVERKLIDWRAEAEKKEAEG